jgi:Bacterial PH domain
VPDKVGAPSGAPDGQIDRGEAAKTRGKVTQGPPPETYRSPLALVVWWVWLAFAVANLIDIAVQGHDRLSLEAAAALVLVTGIMYVGALRPRVIAATRGIVVRNPLRDHRVPWTSVSNVDVRDLLRVHCAWPEPGPESGPNKGQGQQAVQRPENVQRTRVVQAWALQSPRRAGVRPSVGRYELARRSVGGAAAAAEPPRAVHRKETERIARALSERARRQRADAMAARPGAAGGGAADGDSPAGSLANGGVADRPEWAPRPVSAWHWPSVLAIVVPALLLVAAILA